MKKIITVLLVAVSTTLFLFNTSIAMPTTLNDILNPTYILGNGDYSDYIDTNAEALIFTDTDGRNDTATAFLMLEVAAYANGNIFGIYGFSYDANGGVQRGEMLQLFSGDQTAITSQTILIDAENGLAATLDNDGDIINSINLGGTSFGVYLYVTDTENTYYSHTNLNDDGYDHAMIFDTFGNNIWQLMGADVVLAFEDLWNGGDEDFTDMVVGISDVTTAPVPEPTTMLLLGTGLIGLAGLGRRKLKI